MTRFADSGGRKRATGELKSAAQGGGELPTSRHDVETDRHKKSRPNSSGGSKISFMQTVSSSSHRNSG